MIEHDLLALGQLAEGVLMDWLEHESPSDRRRQQALQLLAEAGQLIQSACVNIGVVVVPDPSRRY